MNDGPGVFFMGFVVGAALAFTLVIFFVPTLSEYPGLEKHLSEEQDDCEARPNVISCEWSEDDATFVPKGES